MNIPIIFRLKNKSLDKELNLTLILMRIICFIKHSYLKILFQQVWRIPLV